MKRGLVFLAIAATLVMTRSMAWATIIPNSSLNDLSEGNSVVAASEISSALEDYDIGSYSLTGDIPSDSFTNCTWGGALTEPEGEGWTNRTINDFIMLTGSYGAFGENAISIFWPDDASGQTDALETFQVQGAR